MPQVVVTIDGKTFRMACADGEEAHLESLAAEVDGRIGELRKSFGEIGDQRLVMMAAIMTADELSEQRRRIAALEGAIAEADAARDEALRRLSDSDHRLVGHVEHMAEAVEKAAERLERRV
jgi:cell division protein ZapA